jgi:hypothetical protein
MGMSTFDATSCSHSYSVGGPACWDCGQAGRFNMAGQVPSPGAADFGHTIQHEGYPSSGGSTLGNQSDLPEWNTPEAGLEAVYSDSIPLTALQVSVLVF